MDELFEALTLIQTGKIDPSPVLLFGESWWRRIVDFEAMVEEGVIAPEDLGIFRYVDTAEAAWEAVDAFYRGGRAPRRTRHRYEARSLRRLCRPRSPQHRADGRTVAAATIRPPTGRSRGSRAPPPATPPGPAP